MTDSATMTKAPDLTADDMPKPDPALQQFDRFIGTWEMKGHTLDSDVDNVKGTTTFTRLPGGYFVEQRTKIDFVGYSAESVEIIGYDPATGTFPSTVYPNMIGTPLPYRWTLDGDNVTIKAESLNATFHGKWTGTSFSGGWRPDPGHENDPGNVAYDLTGGRRVN